MGILSNTYETELDVHILVEDVKRMYIFHKQCRFIFDNQWSPETILTQHLSDELAGQINKRMIEQIQPGMFTRMTFPPHFSNNGDYIVV